MDPYKIQRAERLVREVIIEEGADPALQYYVLPVWYSKTLENWKVIFTTNLPDQIIYEVTHNGAKNETYVDVYTKTGNWKFSDGSNSL